MAYVLMYVSEIMFTATSVLLSNLSYLLLAYLFYFMATWILLFIIEYFHVNDVWSLFLAGAFYGWILEGIYRTTMYSAFPIYLSWIGLAWHDLLSVIIFFYFIRRSIILDDKKTIAITTSLLGILWGIFQAGWSQIKVSTVSPFVFSIYSFFATILLIIALFGCGFFYEVKFDPGLKESSVYFLLLIIIYFFDVVFYLQALFLVPILYFLNYYPLNRHRKVHKEEKSLIQILNDAIIIKKVSQDKTFLVSLLLILLIPLFASFSYYLFSPLTISSDIFGWIFIILTFTGFIIYIIAYIKVLRRAPKIENDNLLAQITKEKNSKRKK